MTNIKSINDTILLRVGDLELRKVNHRIGSPDFYYYEIVKLMKEKGKEYCYTIAILDEKSDGYDIRFVGKRPFEETNFMEFAKWCLELLETFNPKQQ